jgi:hypothetical protein
MNIGGNLLFVEKLGIVNSGIRRNDFARSEVRYAILYVLLQYFVSNFDDCLCSQILVSYVLLKTVFHVHIYAINFFLVIIVLNKRRLISLSQ